MKSLFKKLGIYFIGNFSSKILQILLVPIYAFYVSSEELGYYDYVLTLSLVIVPVLFISIWEAAIKFLLGEIGEENKNKIVSTILLFCASLIVVYLGLMGIFHEWFTSVQYLPIVVLMMISSLLAHLWQYISRGYNANKMYALSGVVSTFISLILNIILICVFKMGGLALFISHTIADLVIVVMLECKIKLLKTVRFSDFQFKILKAMLVFSFPLMLNAISGWVIQSISKVIVNARLGVFYNGQYAFANKFCVLISFMGTIVNMAWLEESLTGSSKKMSDGVKADKMFELTSRIFLSVTAVAMPVIFAFYEFLGTTDYYNSRMLVPFLMIYSIVMVLATNIACIFQTEGKTFTIFTTTLTGSVITVLLSYLCIEKFNVYGVATAQIVGALLMIIWRYIIVKQIKQDFKINIFKSLVLVCVIAAVGLWCQPGGFTRCTIAFVVVTVMVVILNLDIIKPLGKGVKTIIAKRKKRNA